MNSFIERIRQNPSADQSQPQLTAWTIQVYVVHLNYTSFNDYFLRDLNQIQ